MNCSVSSKNGIDVYMLLALYSIHGDQCMFQEWDLPSGGTGTTVHTILEITPCWAQLLSIPDLCYHVKVWRAIWGSWCEHPGENAYSTVVQLMKHFTYKNKMINRTHQMRNWDLAHWNCGQVVVARERHNWKLCLCLATISSLLTTTLYFLIDRWWRVQWEMQQLWQPHKTRCAHGIIIHCVKHCMCILNGTWGCYPFFCGLIIFSAGSHWAINPGVISWLEGCKPFWHLNQELQSSDLYHLVFRL